MGQEANPYTHYGKPLLGSALATMAVGGFVLAAGGESLRSTFGAHVVTHVIYLTVVGFLIWLVIDVRTARFKLPNVRAVIEDNLVLLCEPEDWLGYGAGVAVYKADGDYERPVGQGQVINIQRNGLIQIQIIQAFDPDRDPTEFRAEFKSIPNTAFVIKPGLDWKANR